MEIVYEYCWEKSLRKTSVPSHFTHVGVLSLVCILFLNTFVRCSYFRSTDVIFLTLTERNNVLKDKYVKVWTNKTASIHCEIYINVVCRLPTQYIYYWADLDNCCLTSYVLQFIRHVNYIINDRITNLIG